MKSFIAIIACLLVSGCYPVSENIYRPEAPGGKLLETSCNYNQGPGRWDKVELSQDKVRLQAQATEINQELVISVTFIVPDGVTLQLAAPNFYLFDAKERKALEPGEAGFYDRDRQPPGWRKQAPSDPMIGNTFAGRWKPYDQQYTYFFRLPPQKERSEFTLEVPQLKNNGKPASFPRIHFVPAKATYFAGYCK